MRRDLLAFCFQLLIPIIVVIFSLLLLRSGTPTEFPEVLLQPSGLQTRSVDTQVPVLSYYSTETNATGPNQVILDRLAQINYDRIEIQSFGPGSNDIPSEGDLITQLENDLANAASGGGGGGGFFGRRLQSSSAPQPQLDYARLSQYLINNREATEASQMGAFAFKAKLFDDI